MNTLFNILLTAFKKLSVIAMQLLKIVFSFCFLLPFVMHAQQYDLLIKNGHVIDPKNHINAKKDVAVANGKIAKVADNIPASQSKKTIDATGLVCCARFNRYTYACVCGNKAR